MADRHDSSGKVFSSGEYRVSARLSGTQAPPAGDDGSNGVSHVMDAAQTGLFAVTNVPTDQETVVVYRLDGTAEYGPEETSTIITARGASIQRLSSGDLSIVHVVAGSVKRIRWSQADGSHDEATVGSGSLPDHVYDLAGRCIVALFDSAWKVSVGLPNGNTYTFCTPVAMGMGGDQKRGTLLLGMDERILFLVAVGGSVKLYECRDLSDAAAGSWTLKATLGSGTLVTGAADKAGRLLAALYSGGWLVSVAKPDADGAYTSFSTPASMGLSAVEKRGSLRVLPDGEVSVAYVGSGGAVALATCRNQPDTGAGVYA